MTSPEHLVERGVVLRWLASKLNDAQAGHGQVALVSGEAGVGKSAVAEAFIATVPTGTMVFSGACDPLATPVPLGPVLELRDALSPDAAMRLTEASGCLTDLSAAVVAALVDSGPAVWLIDDLQWTDAATTTVLRHLIDCIAHIPVLLVLTYRNEDVGSAFPFTDFLADIRDVDVLSGVELAPLTRAGVMALAVARPGINVDLLLETTGGIPLLVAESLAECADDMLPRNVTDHVVGRLSRLPAGARTLIDAVAVLGSDATIDVLGDVVAHVPSELTAAVMAGVLERRGRAVGFRHELTRQAVLDAIPVFERRALHACAVAVLTADGRESDIARTVFHAQEAGDSDVVLRYAPRAAERAMLGGEFAEAAEQYARAFRHGRGQPDGIRASWLENQARAAYLSGQVVTAAETVAEAIGLRRGAGDMLREGEDHRRLSNYRFFAGAPPAKVGESAETAIRILEPLGPTPELAGAYANAAQLCFVMGDHDGAVDHAGKAESIAEHLGASADAIWAQLFAALSAVHRGDDWSAFDDSWSNACADGGAVEAAAVAGVVACWLATANYDLDRAQRYLTETASLCISNHFNGFEALTAGISTTLLLHRGQYAEALAVAQELLARPNLPPIFRLRPLTTAALVSARTGDFDDAWPLLDEALTGSEASPPWLTGEVRAARIEAAWLAGDQDRAHSEARQALATLPDGVDAWTRGQITAWAAIAGVIGAPSLRGGHPGYVMQVNQQWEAAAAEWRRRGCPYEAGIAGVHSTSAAVADEAVEELRALGASVAAERARTRRRRRQQRRATQSNPFGLTNREQQIAGLLAERHSDKQIAEILVISQRTASNHVASVLAKLGVRNRRAVRGYWQAGAIVQPNVNDK